MAHTSSICNPTNAQLVEAAKVCFRSTYSYSPRLVPQTSGSKCKEEDYAGLIIESMMNKWNNLFFKKPEDCDRETVVSDDSETEMEAQEVTQQTQVDFNEADSDWESEKSAPSPVSTQPSTSWIKINGEIDRKLLKDTDTWLGMSLMADILVGPNHIPYGLTLDEVQNMWPFNQMWSISVPSGINGFLSFNGPMAITVHPTMCWYFLRKLYSEELPTDEVELKCVLSIATYIDFTAEAALKALDEFGPGPKSAILVPFRDWVSSNSADSLENLDVDQMAEDSAGTLLEDRRLCKFLVFQDQMRAIWVLSQEMKKRIVSLINELEAKPPTRSPSCQSLVQRMFGNLYTCPPSHSPTKTAMSCDVCEQSWLESAVGEQITV